MLARLALLALLALLLVPIAAARTDYVSRGHLVPWTAAKSLGSLRGGNAPDGDSTREESENDAAAEAHEHGSASLPTKLRLLASASCGLVVEVLVVKQMFSLFVGPRQKDIALQGLTAGQQQRMLEPPRRLSLQNFLVVCKRELAIIAATRATEALLPRDFRLISAGREIPKGWRLATNDDLSAHREEAMRVLRRQTAARIADGDCVDGFERKVFWGSVAMAKIQGDPHAHRRALAGVQLPCVRKQVEGEEIGKQLIVSNAVGQPWSRGLGWCMPGLELLLLLNECGSRMRPTRVTGARPSESSVTK